MVMTFSFLFSTSIHFVKSEYISPGQLKRTRWIRLFPEAIIVKSWATLLIPERSRIMPSSTSDMGLWTLCWRKIPAIWMRKKWSGHLKPPWIAAPNFDLIRSVTSKLRLTPLWVMIVRLPLPSFRFAISCSNTIFCSCFLPRLPQFIGYPSGLLHKLWLFRQRSVDSDSVRLPSAIFLKLKSCMLFVRSLNRDANSCAEEYVTNLKNMVSATFLRRVKSTCRCCI